MDDESQDDKLLSSLARHRSPVFSKEEVKCIISLIEKYKTILLNKSTNNAACHAKEMAWTKLTEVFNSQGFKYNRNTESIKGKWDNLKRDARKVSKNLMDVDHDDFDEITSQIVNMLVEAENTSEIKDFSEELKVLEEEDSKIPNHDTEKYWDENTNKEINASIEYGVKRRLGVNRSMNFTPEECSILLNCVRPEKKYIFSKIHTGKAIRLKNQAWIRVTRCFNKISPHKRSTKMLQNKFTNMKKLVKKETSSFFKNVDDKKYTKSETDNNTDKKIKAEPTFCLEDEIEADQDVDDNGQVEELVDESTDNYGHHSDNNSNHEAPDPLSTVLSGDSGFGFISMDPPFGKSDKNKDIIKLKMELLQCQLETAKIGPTNDSTPPDVK
ncbi:unnamed protein product [Chilo suppressalis]|uniref:Regulatory protein zeste n=1 Tax=Chilo suppressalis TaxID=168631 RepID=A0ABN8AUM7_CHISP|nr:unnamed protein product [Chilo suppressalis]